jgi:DNA-binding CsgD family transcriptional regulator
MNNNVTIVKKSNLEEKYDVSELHEVCNGLSSLVVSLFNVEEQEFEYCSQSVKQVLGYQPGTLIRSGWDFWYSLLKPEERPVVKQKLSNIMFCDSQGISRNSLVYHIKKTDGNWISIKHEIHHKRYSQKLIALNFIYDNSERELINRYLGIPQQFSSKSDFNGVAKDVTDREKQVLKLIACGLSSRQIAKKLYISSHTAISHRKNLIKKFGVKNTAELIKKASKVISL